MMPLGVPDATTLTGTVAIARRQAEQAEALRQAKQAEDDKKLRANLLLLLNK
jgi:hypothetical protein